MALKQNFSEAIFFFDFKMLSSIGKELHAEKINK